MDVKHDDIATHLLTPLKTANTMAFALGLLALHPDIQEKFYQCIRDVIPDGQIPVSGAFACVAC